MNSELLTLISDKLKELQENRKSLKKELKNLTSNEDMLSRKGKKRLASVKEELESIETEIKEIKNDYTTYSTLTTDLEELEKLVKIEKKASTKAALKKLVDEKKSQKEELEEELNIIYKKPEEVTEQDDNNKDNEIIDAEIVEENKKEKDEEVTEEDKKKAKKVVKWVIGGVCILALIITISQCSKKNQNTPNEFEKDPTPTETVDSSLNNKDDEEIVETITLDSIENAEQLNKRASEIIESLNTNVPGHDYTVEEIENMIKWVNGGIPEEVSQDAAMFSITRFENILNKENQGETKTAFNVSDLFLDGTQGKKLAEKIYNTRSAMLNAKGTPEFEAKAQEFGVLLVNSWLLMGANNEISAYALETSGMKTFIDSYFLNTISIAQSGKDTSLIINVPNAGEFNLTEVNEAINEKNCPTEVTAKNGETFEANFNKLTSDMIGMVTEANLKKQNNNTLTLK